MMGCEIAIVALLVVATAESLAIVALLARLRRLRAVASQLQKDNRELLRRLGQY
jgi:type II secretory pathway component PulJ